MLCVWLIPLRDLLFSEGKREEERIWGRGKVGGSGGVERGETGVGCIAREKKRYVDVTYLSACCVHALKSEDDTGSAHFLPFPLETGCVSEPISRQTPATTLSTPLTLLGL